MRTLAFLSASLLLAASPAWAGEAADVQAVISAQLDAFAHDDATAAYDFAAPPIRQKFADAGGFLAMVKSAYPPVYRHRSVEFGAEARDGDHVRQDVTFVDPDNVVWSGVYVLSLQPGGAWRIEGCALLRSDDTSL